MGGLLCSEKNETALVSKGAFAARKKIFTVASPRAGVERIPLRVVFCDCAHFFV